LTGVTWGAPHQQKVAATFNEVYGVRCQDYGSCNFIRSPIQTSFFSNLTF